MSIPHRYPDHTKDRRKEARIRRGVIILLGVLCGCGEAEESPSDDPSPEHRLDAELAALFEQTYGAVLDPPTESPDPFERALKEALHDPATYRYTFDRLRSLTPPVTIVDSHNGGLRIYQWVHPASGQAVRVVAIAQMPTAQGGVSVVDMRSLYDEGDMGGDLEGTYEALPSEWYLSILRLNDSLFIAKSQRKADGRGMIESAWLWRYDGADSLRIVPSVDAEGKRDEWMEFDRTWYDQHRRPKGDRPATILFDSTTTTFSYPETRSVDGERWTSEPTGDTVRFRFDGERFVRTTSGANR